MYYSPSNQRSGTVGVILVLVGIGLALGLALIGSDLAHPVKSVADLRRSEVETQRIAQQNEIDLHQYETLQEARTRAEIEKLQEETQYQQQLHEEELLRYAEETQYLQQAHEQELKHTQEQAELEMQLLQVATYAGITVVGLCLLLLGIGFSMRIAKRRSAHAKASGDEWTLERKRQEIQVARGREREQREQELSEQVLRQQELDLQRRWHELFSTPVGSNNGHENPDELSSEALSPLQIYE